MDEPFVWIVGAVLGVFLLCVGLGVADDMYATYRVSEMVISGTDPIKAHCAIFGSQSSLDCNIVVAK